ncbi:hypothetical protein QRX60_48835 [Amycolatopsis mongoliensis]|uniref:Uncharacterized protein n=1 Tax=Amycolatopsis mongoliensis TaxID=715475 RepID=A0A9Y2NEI1_9PSEU|nr:hypothetical protein [Amycolatopsis sp. 4-36]WIY01832.1 hypothetical protein QRX60_48835 [Amycolatopsis sp. 4-36]
MASAAPAGPESCTGSPVARFVCDPWQTVNGFMAWVSHTLWSLLQAWWPLLVIAAACALLAGAVLVRVVRQRREREMDGARFFEITPPHRLPADGAVPLWRLLAATLAERSSRTRVALELWAEGADGRVRAGLWVPGGAPAHAVGRAVTQAWPGSKLTETTPPELPRGAVAATELVPREGPWAPLVDHQHRPERGPVAVEDESLRAVLESLTDIATDGLFASVQVVVSPARGTGRRGRGAAGRRGLAGWLGLGLRGLLRGALSVVEMFLSSSSSRGSASASRATVEVDPVVVARQRAAEAKRKAGPHLRATVRLVVAGTHKVGPARQGSHDLAGVLAALATDEHVTARLRVRRAVGKVDRYEHGRGFIASTRELAALWHLPHQPGSHGLSHPEVPQRRADRALPRLDDYRHRRGNQGQDRPDSRRGRRDGFGGERDAA